MATIDLTKPELTPQESEDIRNEVERFEVLYQDRYGALTPAQRANLTRAYQNAVEAGIGLECPADALMAWGVHTGLTNDMLDDDITADKLAGWLDDASALHDSKVDEILGRLDDFSVPYDEWGEVIPDVVEDYIDSLHAGIDKLLDTIQLLTLRMSDRIECFRDDAVEAQDTLTVFREEVEKDYIERASLEPLYELVRDMRDGYCASDMPGAIDKLYNQITELMEGND